MFKKATPEGRHLRCQILGPSGSGKTRTALEIATGIARHTGSRIALIDSQPGQSQMFAERFDFDVHTLAEHTIDHYVKAIVEAAQAGYQVLIVDTLSHAWRWVYDNMSSEGTRWGDKWKWVTAVWDERLIKKAIGRYPGHIICTVRMKMAHAMKTEGKAEVVKLGLEPIQRPETEYEFDLKLEMDREHKMRPYLPPRDLFEHYAEKVWDHPSWELGVEIAQLLEGSDPEGNTDLPWDQDAKESA